MRRLLPTLLLLLAGHLAAGELYKWTDEKGRTHYSDRPPAEDIQAERRELPPAASVTPVDTAPPSEAEQRCEQARKSLQTLRDNPRVAMDLDGDGTPEELNAAAREAQIGIAERNLQRLCAAPAPAPDDAEGE